MHTSVRRRMLMGLGGAMLPVPRLVSARGLRAGVSEARKRTASLSGDEQRIHHFVVRRMATATQPITALEVSEATGLALTTVESAVARLEGMKTYLYRSGGAGIDWAYPLSLDNTGHLMTAATGERFFAA